MNHPTTGKPLPLVPAVSQFDGGPKQSENCTAASAARLRRYMTGVPTTGTQVRSNQSDQAGGISIPDALCALRRMAPVVKPNWAAPFDSSAKPDPINHISGAISERALISLLDDGYMVVVQGDYGDLPIEWREQKTFTDDHAFTVDATFGVSTTRSYYIVDTIPRKGSGYKGRVIPGKALMQYAYGLAGTGRIYATWGRPPAPPVVKYPKPGWGSEVRHDIQDAYKSGSVAAKLRSLGLDPKSTVNNVDMEAGCKKRGIRYGTSIQLVDVRRLMKPGTGPV